MPDATKICVRCKQDCSTRPRTKDPQGRYTCRECLDALAAAPHAAPSARSAATADAVIPIVDVPLPAGLIAESAPPIAGLQTCPSCQSSVPHGAAICVQCGLDLRKGRHLAIDKSLPKEESAIPPRQGKCGKCGYSLKGLKAPRCPECGTLVGRLSDKERRDQLSKDTAKWAYLKPLIQLAIGFAGAAIYYSAMEHPELIPIHALKYVIQVPIGLFVFLTCCLIWIGFDAPIHLLALRFAAVYSLVDLTAIVMGFIPIWFLQLAVVLFVYIGLLAESMDLDIQDAVIVALLTFGLRLVIMMVVFVAMFASGP